MALEITGTLVKTLPEVGGQSQKGPWSKQEFIIETLDASYPKKVCLTAWGDKVGDLKAFAEGEIIKATFSAESREYNERWYTELRAFRIEGSASDEQPVGKAKAQPQREQPAAKTSPLTGQPFQTTFDDESNDLPF
jgi:hypothetical protein